MKPIPGEPRETNHPETSAADEIAELLAAADGGSSPLPLRDWVDLVEAWYITRALRRCRGNRSAAARMLGIGRRTLYAKMEKLGIQPTWSANGVRTLSGPDIGAPDDGVETRAGEAPLPRMVMGNR